MKPRISSHQLARLAAEMTDRDREIVAVLARVKLASGDQLRRALWPESSPADRRAARRTLERLTRWRVLARLERRVGGLGRGSSSWTYALDVAGQRLGDQAGARRPHLPREMMWQHALTGAEAYVRLAERLRDTTVTLSAYQGEPESWRHFAGPYGEPLVLKPDAFVRLDGEAFVDSFFLEIDTGSQSRTVIRTKLDQYRRYAATNQEQQAEGVFPRVFFLTTTAARVELLDELVAALPPEVRRLFAVGLVCQVGRLLVPEASS